MMIHIDNWNVDRNVKSIELVKRLQIINYIISEETTRGRFVMLGYGSIQDILITFVIGWYG